MTHEPTRARFGLRVSLDEKRTITERAKARGSTVSDYLRQMGQHGLVQPVPSIRLDQWGRLSGLAFTLNQEVRRLNAGEASQELVPTLEVMRDQVAAIRQDLAIKPTDQATALSRTLEPCRTLGSGVQPPAIP